MAYLCSLRCLKADHHAHRLQRDNGRQLYVIDQAPEVFKFKVGKLTYIKGWKIGYQIKLMQYFKVLRLKGPNSYREYAIK